MVASSTKTTRIATVVATLKLCIRYGSVWPMPPSAVVGQRLGKTHAYASPERCGEADRKGVPGVLGSKRRREDGCERRNRTVHQSGQSWLYDLQDEESSFSLVLFFANLRPELGFLQLSS